MSDEFYNLFEYLKQPVEKEAQKLIKKYFPGALTLVLDKSEKTPDYITSSLPTVGVRIPDNKIFAEICKNIEGRVLATTSANLSGEAPALSYEEAVKYIGDKVDLVIPDYGCEAKGRASTVAGFKEGKTIIFRQGEIIIYKRDINPAFKFISNQTQFLLKFHQVLMRLLLRPVQNSDARLRLHLLRGQFHRPVCRH